MGINKHCYMKCRIITGGSSLARSLLCRLLVFQERLHKFLGPKDTIPTENDVASEGGVEVPDGFGLLVGDAAKYKDDHVL